MNIDPIKVSEGYNRIIGEINHPHVNLRNVSEKILDVLLEVFDADRADIAIIREDFDIETTPLTEENAVRIRVSRGYAPDEWERLGQSGVLMESIRHAIVSRESQIFSDTRDEAPGRADLSAELGTGCWMNYVLVMGGRAVANVHLAKRQRFHFQLGELKQLEYMSQLLATAINIAHLWEKEKILVLGFIDSLNVALGVRDRYTAGHVERVKLYSELIARQMALPDEGVELIKTAAILHDLGKIGVPDHILKKKGTLSAEEREEIQHHVDMTDEILRHLTYFDEARELAVYHHESFDGKGYVRGAKGEEIPLGARIIAVADAFDAMTSERAYRRSFYVEEALDVLLNPGITQWDRRVVDAFAAVLRSDAFHTRASQEGLIRLREGKYDRDDSSLKFRQLSRFFAVPDKPAG